MKEWSNWLIAIGIVALIGGGVWWMGSSKSDSFDYNNVATNQNNTAKNNQNTNSNANANTNSANTQNSQATLETGKLTKEISADDHTKGPTDAQIKLVAYEDYECPACRQLNPLFESMVDKFPGKVSFTFRHFPLDMHKNAMPAAQMAESANTQGKFWEMHKLLMEGQTVSMDNAYLKAKELGMDIEKIKADVANNTFKDAILASRAEGDKSGVKGTPSLYLNGDILQWAETTDLENTIKKKLGQ